MSFRAINPASPRPLFLMNLRHSLILDEVVDEQETGGSLLKEGENDESRVHGLGLSEFGLRLTGCGAISSAYRRWFPPSFPDV
ncbi:hypothetical protein [Bosea sp. OK403]|uniref:hypothetical protein n=1 Tax=Bosea sp. OK403 TaxID=1855286 RepID=UPI001113E1F8|nr:hypothetical protein [Bosea sp. OK403]